MSLERKNNPISFLDFQARKKETQHTLIRSHMNILGGLLDNSYLVPGEIEPELFYLKNEGLATLITTQSELIGIGRKNVYFRHLVNNTPQLEYQNTLELELHTDAVTTEKVTELFEVDQTIEDLVGTIYSFDAEGVLQKLAFLPNDIPDERPITFFSHLPRHGVQSEVTGDDFSLISRMLMRFEESLRR